jgi:hypothetical protein
MKFESLACGDTLCAAAGSIVLPLTVMEAMFRAHPNIQLIACVSMVIIKQLDHEVKKIQSKLEDIRNHPENGGTTSAEILLPFSASLLCSSSINSALVEKNRACKRTIFCILAKQTQHCKSQTEHGERHLTAKSVNTPSFDCL